MKSRSQGAAGPGRRRRKQPRDVTVTKAGKITIKGKTLEKLERLAKEAGMTPKEFFNRLLREEMQDPQWLEAAVREEQIRECRRVMSWCDRRRLA